MKRGLAEHPQELATAQLFVLYGGTPAGENRYRCVSVKNRETKTKDPTLVELRKDGAPGHSRSNLRSSESLGHPSLCTV